MFRAIGFILVLFFVSRLFSGAAVAFEEAAIATFNTLKTAAEVSEVQLRTSASR